MLCIGLIADDGRNPTVVTFDTIRKLIDRQAAGPTPGLRDRLAGLLRRKER